MNLGFFEYFQVLRILFRDPFIFLRVEASDFFYGNFRRKKLEASRCFMEHSFFVFEWVELTKTCYTKHKKVKNDVSRTGYSQQSFGSHFLLNICNWIKIKRVSKIFLIIVLFLKRLTKENKWEQFIEFNHLIITIVQLLLMIKWKQLFSFSQTTITNSIIG